MRNKMDAWYEEDEQVFVHPKDPYHRVDVLESSRNVKVTVDGEVVAVTDRPKVLFETGLPPRYYIPPEDVREDILVASEKTTQCPYKGVASYYSVEAGGERVEDLVWYYPEPLPEVGIDRWAPVLLQREGGPRGGRRGAGAAAGAVVVGVRWIG